VFNYPWGDLLRRQGAHRIARNVLARKINALADSPGSSERSDENDRSCEKE